MFLARFLVRHYAKDFDMEFRVLLLDAVKRAIRPDDMIKDLAEQFFTKRNELRTLLGQFVLSSLVIVVVAILLLAQVITAEASLPILSAIAGFAIGKGTTSTRTILPSKGQQTEQS
jgi:hypothetical protein